MVSDGSSLRVSARFLGLLSSGCSFEDFHWQLLNIVCLFQIPFTAMFCCSHSKGRSSFQFRGHSGMCSVGGQSKVIEGWMAELRLTWLIGYGVLIDLVVSGGIQWDYSMGI